MGGLTGTRNCKLVESKCDMPPKPLDKAGEPLSPRYHLQHLRERYL